MKEKTILIGSGLLLGAWLLMRNKDSTTAHASNVYGDVIQGGQSGVAQRYSQLVTLLGQLQQQDKQVQQTIQNVQQQINNMVQQQNQPPAPMAGPITGASWGAAFGKTAGQPGWDARLDLNHDGRISVQDYSLWMSQQRQPSSSSSAGASQFRRELTYRDRGGDV